MSHTIVAREPVVEALREQWQVLDELVGGLSEAQWDLPTALPGWTVRDVLAHVIGTESLLAGRRPPELGEDGEREIAAAEHVRNEIGAFNERWVQGLRELSPAELLEQYREIVALRTAALEGMTQADFDAEAMTPVGPETYGRFMRIRVFDCWMHELDLRDALGVGGESGGARVELAMSEIFGALGYLVGKRTQAPRPGAVTLELTGPVERTLYVEVGEDGRAGLVDTPNRPADASVRLDSGLFARLAGGRTTAGAHDGEVAFDGDSALGHRVAENLAFTI